MDPKPDSPAAQDANDLMAEETSPWIPVGAAHLLFWVALIWPFIASLLLSQVLPRLGPAAPVLAWTFTVVHWALGGGAILLGFRGEQTEKPNSLRRDAFLAAIAIWLIQAAIGLAFQFHRVQVGDILFIYMRIRPFVSPVVAAVPLLMLMASREPQSGGTFDASVAALAVLGGLGFLGPLLLACGALIGGHPLLAVAWDALGRPPEALRGEWFDGGDGALNGRRFGQLALAFALGAPFMAVVMAVSGALSRGGFDATTQWIRPLAAWLSSLPLALATFRMTDRGAAGQGRGMAIAALVLFGLLLLPVLLLMVFLALLATHALR